MFVISRSKLFDAFMNGKPIQVNPKEKPVIISSIEREDGSGHCWNVTVYGYTCNEPKRTVFIRTIP